MAKLSLSLSFPLTLTRACARGCSHGVHGVLTRCARYARRAHTVCTVCSHILLTPCARGCTQVYMGKTSGAVQVLQEGLAGS
eukprot:2657394-Rhodomonas_salina.1